MNKSLIIDVFVRQIRAFALFGFSLTFSMLASAQDFNHPGTLNSKADLDFIKAKVEANAEPWKSAWEALKKSDFANLNYNYKAFDVTRCGHFNMPNEGCSPIVRDPVAAYTMALRWYIGGDQRYANKAIEICLLYTSPSPRDLSTSRMPSSA